MDARSQITTDQTTAYGVLEGAQVYAAAAGATQEVSTEIWHNAIGANRDYQYMNVNSGGKAMYCFVSSGGEQRVYSGGVASNNFIYSGGVQKVYNGGRVVSSLVSGGNLMVSSGGTADGAIVYNGGNMYVYYGGTATNAKVSSGGLISVDMNANVTNTTVYSGGSMHIWLDAVAGKTVLSGGYQSVAGTANNTSVYFGGCQEVFSSFRANDTYVFNGGVQILNGGSGNNGVVYSGGVQIINSGGVASYFFVDEGGLQYVTQGGAAEYSYIIAGGTIKLESGGIASNTVIFQEGLLDTTGGILKGNIECGGRIKANYTAFAISGSLTFKVNDDARNNAMLYEAGTYPQGSFTVSADLSGVSANYSYILVDGAWDFGSIDISLDGRNYYTVSTGESRNILKNGVDYMITWDVDSVNNVVTVGYYNVVTASSFDLAAACSEVNLDMESLLAGNSASLGTAENWAGTAWSDLLSGGESFDLSGYASMLQYGDGFIQLQNDKGNLVLSYIA